MNQEQTNDEAEIDLVELFYVLRSKIWIILLSTMVLGVAFFLTSKFLIKPVYSSTSKLFILTKTTSITSLADIQMGSQLTLDYVELIKSRPVVEGVIKNLKLDMEYEEMLEKVEITTPSNTRILNITIEDNDPRLAKEIVDEFSNVSIERISLIMATDKPNIAEEGHVAEKPIKPENKKNALIGALLGFVLSCGIIIVIHLLDDTIRSLDDVERYLGLNTLAMIPLGKEEYDGKKRKKKLFERIHSQKSMKKIKGGSRS